MTNIFQQFIFKTDKFDAILLPLMMYDFCALFQYDISQNYETHSTCPV